MLVAAKQPLLALCLCALRCLLSACVRGCWPAIALCAALLPLPLLLALRCC